MNAKSIATGKLMGTIQAHRTISPNSRAHKNERPRTSVEQQLDYEQELRKQLEALPGTLRARGLTVKTKPIKGSGFEVLPAQRLYYYQGKSYVGFSIR